MALRLQDFSPERFLPEPPYLKHEASLFVRGIDVAKSVAVDETMTTATEGFLPITPEFKVKEAISCCATESKLSRHISSPTAQRELDLFNDDRIKDLQFTYHDHQQQPTIMGISHNDDWIQTCVPDSRDVFRTNQDVAGAQLDRPLTSQAGFEFPHPWHGNPAPNVFLHSAGSSCVGNAQGC